VGRTLSGTRGSTVPGHVAWVARGRERPTDDEVVRRLLMLVEAAEQLGIAWMTIQEPSGGGVLGGRAAELAARGIVLSTVGADAGHALAPRDLVEVGSPNLRVLLADERSGRRQLVSAMHALAARGARPQDVSEKTVADVLGVPDVDLLVLTGGDRRVPDLLVWQVAYSEIVVLDEPWPNVSATLLRAAVAEYQRRDRRYGGLVAAR
jgi:hypothetical protein